MNTTQETQLDPAVPHGIDFNDPAYAEAHALAKDTQGAENARKAVSAERAGWKKVARMTRGQVLDSLQRPDVAISAEDYNRVMTLFAKAAVLKKQGKMDEAKAFLKSMNREDKLLLRSALRSKKLIDQLDEATREVLAESDILVNQMSDEQDRLTALERELFGDIEDVILADDAGSQPLSERDVA